MERAFIKVVREGSDETLGGGYFEGDGALKWGYDYWKYELNRRAEKQELAYAKCGRDFNDQLLGQVVLKAEAEPSLLLRLRRALSKIRF